METKSYWQLEKSGHQCMWALRDEERVVICTLSPLLVRSYYDLYNLDLRELIDTIVVPGETDRPALLEEDRSILTVKDKKKELARRVKKREAEVWFTANFKLG